MEVQIKNPKTGEVKYVGQGALKLWAKRGFVPVGLELPTENNETEKKPVEVVENPNLGSDETATDEAPAVDAKAPAKRGPKAKVSIPNQ
jgi:hypothetical protein